MYQTKLSLEHDDGAPRAVVAKHGLVTYEPAFLAPAEAAALLGELLGEVTWRQEHLRIHGRAIPFPRLAAWYGDPGALYTYSGIENRPQSWTPALARLRDRLRAATGAVFNSALLNLYRTGSDSMGWHADDEPELGPQPVIASVSLGAARRFELRSRETGETRRVVLEHGSLLVMSGETQHCWKHQVPKEPTVRAPRINLTFRTVEVART
ncbi:MAG TPA: alpha-ketoglutarate-dependent dioxygenase AlkB [Candidatus Elarobacter sp.]|jgi:alkylated DNA repair dioxygenase AlkB|nr:alpha-ketoglutarate-dependent dioxygenase AlkB [Candidatus Elarobacter sp.]